MPIIPISVNYSGNLNFTASAASQRSFILNSNLPSFLRIWSLTQDNLSFTNNQNGITIQFPLTNLISAAAAASGLITIAPQIVTQPTSSTVTHTSSSYFTVGATSESTITYQWYSSSFLTSSVFNPLPSPNSVFTGSLTAALTHSNTVIGDSGSNYLCVVSNSSGATTSSAAILYVL